MIEFLKSLPRLVLSQQLGVLLVVGGCTLAGVVVAYLITRPRR